MSELSLKVAKVLLKEAKDASKFHGNDWKNDPTLVWADDAINKIESPQMFELGDRNYTLISSGIKSSGSYDPNKIFPYFEEQLYVTESQQIFDFLQWVHEGEPITRHGMTMTSRAFGSGNYEERFQEYLNSKK